jgi:hypothetical protein
MEMHFSSIIWRHEAIAKLLIEKGADVNAQGGIDGNALQQHHLEAMRQLQSC